MAKTDERVAKVVALLDEAAQTHHRVYRITAGADFDWASWYADWLNNLSELPKVLGEAPVRSKLVHALVQLDMDYVATLPDVPWAEFYAPVLLERFSVSTTRP